MTARKRGLEEDSDTDTEAEQEDNQMDASPVHAQQKQATTVNNDVEKDIPGAAPAPKKTPEAPEAGPSQLKETNRPAKKIRKLAPPRPFPTVSPAVSATGPPSSHTEGRDHICVTRRLPLAGYLRRCKGIIMDDGYRKLHLSALGAAIPHLLNLVVSLPETLPLSTDEVHTEITTGTVEVQDEVIPDDEEEDITLQKRSKSSLSAVITIGDGERVGRPVKKQSRKGKSAKASNRTRNRQKSTQNGANAASIVVQEPDQDEDGMEL